MGVTVRRDLLLTMRLRVVRDEGRKRSGSAVAGGGPATRSGGPVVAVRFVRRVHLLLRLLRRRRHGRARGRCRLSRVRQQVRVPVVLVRRPIGLDQGTAAAAAAEAAASELLEQHELGYGERDDGQQQSLERFGTDHQHGQRSHQRQLRAHYHAQHGHHFLQMFQLAFLASAWTTETKN